MLQININASKCYDVMIERGLLSKCGNLIRSVCAGKRAVIVCGDIVDKLYADAVSTQLASSGYDVFRFVYPHGEGSKNAKTYIELLNFMAESGLDRSDVVIALGGGVTGDLAGFAAASYMRGISCVQIPTTLLSMVDSSVGGKTAINLDSGKNLAGAFHQPSLVICDPDTLNSLPKEILSDGCAEIIKYAVLRDPEIIEKLADFEANTEDIIFRCVCIKRDYVQADELDCGKRQFLNLGHTAAHAIESLSDYGISHGHAVAIGLAIIANAAEANGDCVIGTGNAIINALSSVGLPTDCEYEISELCKLMLKDKKRQSVDITLVIPCKIGECRLKKLPLSQLEAYLSGGAE